MDGFIANVAHSFVIDVSKVIVPHVSLRINYVVICFKLGMVQ